MQASPWLVGAGVLTGVGLILALVGLITTLSADLYSTTTLHGATCEGVARVLVVLAIAAYAGATRPLLSRANLIIGAVGAGLAVASAFAGLVVAHVSGFERGGSATQALSGFAEVLAFATVGWLIYTRPLTRRRAALVAWICGAVGLPLALIGLLFGLGRYSDWVHGQGWLGLALVLALLAAGSVIGTRSEPTPGGATDT